MSETRTVTLAELVQAMHKSPDSDVFRWFQDSYVASDGSIHAGVTYRVTMAQVRAELGIMR